MIKLMLSIFHLLRFYLILQFLTINQYNHMVLFFIGNNENIANVKCLLSMQSHIQANFYGMGRDANTFPDPLNYRPERWLRSDAKFESTNALASLPFGQGARMCIGMLVTVGYLLNCNLISFYKMLFIVIIMYDKQ